MMVRGLHEVGTRPTRRRSMKLATTLALAAPLACLLASFAHAGSIGWEW